jgi:hypothetical protein
MLGIIMLAIHGALILHQDLKRPEQDKPKQMSSELIIWSHKCLHASIHDPAALTVPGPTPKALLASCTGKCGSNVVAVGSAKQQLAAMAIEALTKPSASATNAHRLQTTRTNRIIVR